MNMECTPTEQEDTLFTAPNGYYFTSVLESNQSTTFYLRDPYDNPVYSMNTGMTLTCWVMGAGVGLAVQSFTGNSRVAQAAASLTALGCKKATQSSGEDGDSYKYPDGNDEGC